MNNKLSYILLICTLLGGAMTSCSDDDAAVKDAIEAPATTLNNATYNALSFSWEKVTNAIQYGYVLSNPSGKVVGEGTTVYTTASFSGLLPSTEYTLKVWAFPSVSSDYSTSPTFTLTATTADLLAVGVPQVTVSMIRNNATISWDETDGATGYEYTVTGPNGYTASNGDEPVTDTSFTLPLLENGTYTITIHAVSTTPGYESVSADAVETFVVDYTPSPIVWEAKGTYTSACLGTSWEATIQCFNDGTYTLLGWYGVEGYDLTFARSASDPDQITLLNGTGYYKTGLSSAAYIYLYDGEYSSFWGDAHEGEIWFYAYNYYTGAEGYDSFTWEFSTENLAGNYLYNFSCQEWWTYSWVAATYDGCDAVITKIDDTNVEVDGLYYSECPVKGVIDPATYTITIPVQTYATYYIMAQNNWTDYAPTTPVSLQVNADGTITAKDVCIWYDGQAAWGGTYGWFQFTNEYEGTMTRLFE